MPIFFQQDIDQYTKLAIWKIEEAEEFFSGKVPLQRTITHPHKRLQHLAARFLLRELFPDFPLELIRIADTRKPFLEDEAYHFSVSHCGDYAAVIVSKVNRVGVDLEIISEKVDRIRHKFITDGEEEILQQPFLTAGEPGHYKYASGSAMISVREEPNKIIYNPSDTSVSTLIWSCKEAVFKWYGMGQVDFKGHMQLKSISEMNGDGYETVVLFKKNEELFLTLHSRFFGNICLSYVLT